MLTENNGSLYLGNRRVFNPQSDRLFLPNFIKKEAEIQGVSSEIEAQLIEAYQNKFDSIQYERAVVRKAKAEWMLVDHDEVLEVEAVAEDRDPETDEILVEAVEFVPYREAYVAPVMELPVLDEDGEPTEEVTINPLWQQWDNMRLAAESVMRGISEDVESMILLRGNTEIVELPPVEIPEEEGE